MLKGKTTLLFCLQVSKPSHKDADYHTKSTTLFHLLSYTIRTLKHIAYWYHVFVNNIYLLLKWILLQFKSLI